jgi:hypothetical protein
MQFRGSAESLDLVNGELLKLEEERGVLYPLKN